MRRNLPLAAVVAVILGLFVWKYVSTNFFGPPDQTLIRQALDRAILASKEGRPGGVMDFLADKFSVNSSEYGSRQIANFIKDGHPDVSVPDEPAIIADDKARITAPVRIKVSYLGFNLDQTVDNVSLVFERETGREWLFIPVPQWKLAQVQVPDDVIPTGY